MKEFERQTENPIDRLEREVHQLNTEIFRLENENDLLAQELVTNKISLRKDLDDVRLKFLSIYFHQYPLSLPSCCYSASTKLFIFY